MLLAALWSCATPTPPNGGPKDETPPRIVQEKSTPNFQTRFQKQTIELTFDEWVQLNDVFTQVVISPPLDSVYDVKLKGRTVRFIFDPDEVLRPNATYTINFGDAVKDLTERNPAENLRFVFSTGDYLDSLSLDGRIYDAYTGQVVENALFMLYDNPTDSVVYQERPFYFGRTNKEGKFRIDNIKYADFKGFALKDADLDYKYSQKIEPVGFPDTLIRMQDTTVKHLVIRLFSEEPVIRVQDVDTSRFGIVKLEFNRSPEKIEAVAEGLDGGLIPEVVKDSLRIWYNTSREWTLYLRQDTLSLDTLVIRPKSGGKFSNLVPDGGARSKVPVTALPGETAKIHFNRPLAAFDTAFIRLFQDTLPAPISLELAVDTVPQRDLLLSQRWKEGSSYRLEILPGGLTDWYGNANRDTITRTIKGDLLKNYGNLILTVTNLDSTTAYFIEVTTKDGTPVHTYQVRGQSADTRSFLRMKPADYTVRITTDLNGNGRWDTGNYDLKRQPEPIVRQVLEQLRANWDLEATVDLKTVPMFEEPKKKETEGAKGPGAAGGRNRGGG